MRISLARLLLPLLLAFAFVVRWEPTRTLRLAPDEQRDLDGAAWLIDDPATCHALRRVELAMASDQVPAHDRFVNFPADGEIPSFALYDGCVAGIAQRLLRSPGGEAALGGVDERALEDFVIRLAPILGLVAVLATYWAARTIAGGARADLAAILATAFVAFHPATIGASAAGTLDSAALTTIVCALLVRSTVRSIRAAAMPASLLDALVAGGLAGILVAGSVAGLAAFVPAWIAFFVHARRSHGEERANALRSGLFFTLVAAFLARMPVTEGSLDEGHVLGGFSAGASLLVFFTAVPYLLLILFERERKPSMFRVACFVVALGVMATQVPTAWRQLAPAVTWFTSQHALLAVVVPEFTAHATDPGFVVLALASVVVLRSAWIGRAEIGALALGAFVLVLGVASSITVLAAPLWAVAVACALAREIDAEGATRRLTIGAHAVIVVLVGLALWPALAGSDAMLRQERLDFVAGLRWMRSRTESGGPWNSARSPSAWGVLSNTADGPLVLYHARRPALSSPWGALSGPKPLVETSARLHANADPAALERLMQGQGARYVVVAGRSSRAKRDPRAGEAHGGSAADQLLAAAAAETPHPLGAFVLEHASRRQVDAAGRTTLDRGLGHPVIAIWRLEARGGESPHAELHPR